MKKYTARPHAIDRAILRFGITTEHAENWFNQLMMNARYLGAEGKRKVYDHKGKRIIVQDTEIITIFSVADLPFAGKVAKLVEREVKKAKKEADKRIKELSIAAAEVTIENATLSLNYLKAKSPSAKRSIQAKLDAGSERLRKVNAELDREKDAYKALEIQSHGYMLLGGETA
ncbi:hypothetical protein [Mesobacillus zeae]|uniref:hypothetical protein n=1 Tax=Mesobacillus zeae TaxID=1917180 RepID=UPI003009015B